MGVDLGRVANKALEAALEDGEQRHHRSGLRMVAAGAALAVVARAAVSKAPGLVRIPGLSDLRDIPDRVRDRLSDVGWLDDEAPVDEEELLEDEEPVDDEDFEEPEAEAEPADDEEEYDEEDEPEDEPENEAEEDFDEEEEEPEDEEDEEPPPELEIESEDDEDLHPEDRPPKPPRSKANAR